MSPILSYKAQRCEMTLDRLQRKTTAEVAAAASKCEARPPPPTHPPALTHARRASTVCLQPDTALRLNAAIWYHFTAVGVLEQVSVCLG